jgi:FMN phosphatase YigB (HAD superfamily)
VARGSRRPRRHRHARAHREAGGEARAPGLVRYLDPKAIFISDQIGISKPNPKLYLAAVRELGLKPNEVMYVGDSLEHDIAPPKSIEMVTVWARRGSKHPTPNPSIVPDHVVDNFQDLEKILRDTYGVPLT